MVPTIEIHGRVLGINVLEVDVEPNRRRRYESWFLGSSKKLVREDVVKNLDTCTAIWWRSHDE
jgi:hypothetical protein